MHHRDANSFHPDNRKPEQSADIAADLELRLQQQEAIAWFGEYALSCQDLDDLFQQCVELTARILDLELTKILELQPGGDSLLLRAGVGWHAGLAGSATVGAGADSQAGFTLLTDEPIIVDDLASETRFNGPQLLFDHNVISGMSVTILGKDRPFGVLGVHTPRRRRFTIHDTRFLKSIANILASAVERFRAETELRRSRDEMAIIFNGISEGVTAQDPTGRLVYANSAAAALLGYESAEALLATPLAAVLQKFELLDEDGSPLTADALPSRQALQHGVATSGRLRFRILATGEENWSIVDSSPVFDAQDRVALVVNIFRNITASVLDARRQQLISDAGKLLSSSLDYEEILSNLADLAVRDLADWCTVHILTDKDEILQLAVAHKEPEKRALAREFNRRYPPSWEHSPSLARVLRGGEAVHFPEISDEMLQASARNPEHLELMRDLGMRSALQVPLTARGKTLGALSLIWAESGRRYGNEEVAAAQELAQRAAVAIDNARLYREAQRLNTELEERVLLRTEQLQRANRNLLDEVNERIKAENALRESEALLQSLFESAPDATVLINRSGIIERVNRQAEVIFGFQRDELVGAPVSQLLPSRYQARHASYQAGFFQQALVRPMGAGSDLFARRKDGVEFPVDIMLSPVIHHEGELVIASIRDMTEQKRLQAELAETHRRLFESVEAERLSLSRELHDGPIQDLYGLSFNHELLGAALHEPGDLETLEASKETVLAVIQTLRGICGELRPATLEHMGLEKAIRSYISRMEETHADLEFDLHVTEDGQRLPERARLAIYRVFQNAVTNAVRHAQPTRVQVSFSISDDRARLEVRDDGCGFLVPDKWVELARSGHFGLVGMQERIQAVGGSLSVISAPGEGTSLTAEVPIMDNPAL